MISQLKAKLAILVFCLVSLGLLLLVFKGKPAENGDGLAYQFDGNAEITGPFESSNSSSRFALVEAIVYDHSLSLNLQQARLAAPDLVYYHNKFQTIFTPGISFVAVPFFWLGSWFRLPQLGAYFSTIVFALLNTFLIYKLARKLSASTMAALLGSFSFLFGSNALAYALTLTQHHGSVAIILMALLVVLDKISWRNCLAFGLLCGVGLLFDYPNLFMLFPMGLYLLSQAIPVGIVNKKLKISIQLQILAIGIGLLPLIGLYGWYNLKVADSPLKIGQFIGRTNYFDTQDKKDRDAQATVEGQKDAYAPKLPFQTRIQLQGITVLGVSNERSWFFYSPVLWIGVFGLWYLLRQPDKSQAGVLIMSVVVADYLIYSMFGDPWGGWSFGARYLLPGAALMSILIGVALTHYRSWLLRGLFVLLLTYSVIVNTAGAVTSSAIPPKQEAEALSVPIPYTYAQNFRLIHDNKISSLVYNLVGHQYLSSYGYYYLVTGLVLATGGVLCGLFIINAEWKHKHAR